MRLDYWPEAAQAAAAFEQRDLADVTVACDAMADALEGRADE